MLDPAQAVRELAAWIVLGERTGTDVAALADALDALVATLPTARAGS